MYSAGSTFVIIVGTPLRYGVLRDSGDRSTLAYQHIRREEAWNNRRDRDNASIRHTKRHFGKIPVKIRWKKQPGAIRLPPVVQIHLDDVIQQPVCAKAVPLINGDSYSCCQLEKKDLTTRAKSLQKISSLASRQMTTKILMLSADA